MILNVRDRNVVEIYNPLDEGELYDISSYSDESELTDSVVGVRILTSELEYPKLTKSPQISRVDGNHRLHETDEVLKEWWQSGGDGHLDREFPSVPFTMLLDLDFLQEARLFRDINGEHEGMETAHLDTLQYRILSDGMMKSDIKLLPLWLAHKLTETDRAFEGMVFFGGVQGRFEKGGGADSAHQDQLFKDNDRHTVEGGALR